MKQNKSAISRFQDFLETQKGQTILNYLYSWGAAIVILGALFKLTHIAGADLMLFLGMGTEVLTFIVNGFERQSSAKETEAPAAAGGPVIIGGAPVAAGTVVAAPATNVAPAAVASVGAAPQLDAEALNAMANIAAANAAVAAASAGTPQIDTEALAAMASIAAANASAAGATAPVIEGKVDVPEMQQVTQDYVEQLRVLTESFQHIAEQASQLEASADEIERLSRNLTTINTIYEMHLKSLGSQIGNIDFVNEQTCRMAEQIEELNQVYDRMLQSMTVNMKTKMNKEA